MKFSWKPSARSWRRFVQVVCLALFLWLFRQTEFDPFAAIPEGVNFLFQLDPLVGASAMLAAGKVIVALLVPGILLLAATFVLGRFFCGWVCPLGTLLDTSRAVVPKRWVRPRGDAARTPGAGRDALGRWRKAKYAILFVVLAGALVGLPIVGYFDPFSLLVRGLAFAVDPIFTYLVKAPMDWLYANSPESLQETIDTVYVFLEDNVLSLREAPYLLSGVSFLLLAAVFALEFLERRFWCRNLCPLGALLALAARFSLLKRKPLKACKGCLQCAGDCRMGAFDEEARMAPEACNLCMDCNSDCPHGMVTFRFGKPAVAPAPFNPSRRLFFGAAGTSIALAAAARLEGSAAAVTRPKLLRPPGVAPEPAGERAFLDLCVRCGLCMKVCPTGALQPTGLGGGWDACFSPRLVPRIGFCEFNCTACSEVCPTGAIPRLTQDEKHEAVIGKAAFDKSRCLPYARGQSCIVCEEHCPVPDKAIRAREVETTTVEGEKVTVKQPYVQLDLCIGCGICETKCPLQGAAGIRVYHVNDTAILGESEAMGY